MDPIELEPLGDRAFLSHFVDEPAAARWAAAVRDLRWPQVTDVVLAYRTVAVFVDPDQTDPGELGLRLRMIAPADRLDHRGRKLTIPVLYDGADLDRVAARLELSADQVIALHAGVTYCVFAIGFIPGFPYAGYLPGALSGLPRRDAPRLRVPAGSVGIAGRQTGIYPTESPGGWHLLGRTPLRIADSDTGTFLLRAGDRIQFAPISVSDFEARCHEQLPGQGNRSAAND
jgi:KipI family sensor histidine kinase inhibitor